jgi:hypothetical protein
MTKLAVFLSALFHLLEPEPAFLECCYASPDGSPATCSKLPPGKTECEEGGVLHRCEDELTCSEDGSVCWHECEPVSSSFDAEVSQR